MIVRQTATTILSLQLILLLLLSRHVASISLSQFQQISGFSDSCENVWQEDIPGCTKKDFSSSNDCSRNCLAGVNIINAEVLVACAEARVSSNTLLGEFLAGFGVSALCGSSDSTETATMADSTTATATAVKTTATSTSLTSVHSTTTTTTAVQETTTQPSVLSTTARATTSIPSSATTSSPSATSITDLTFSFTGTTTASPTSSVSSTTTTSTKSTSTSSSNTEAKGFGGVGDAFDILGGESAGSRLQYVSWEVMSLTSVLVMAIASGIW